MMALRWKLWEMAAWLAWWLCPDKKALGLIMRHGAASRAAMDAIKDRQP